MSLAVADPVTRSPLPQHRPALHGLLAVSVVFALIASAQPACNLFPNAQVMALDEEIAVAEGSEPPGGLVKMLGPNPVAKRAHVSRGLKDGDVIQVGDLAMRVFAVPGHTRGSAAYLARDTLF